MTTKTTSEAPGLLVFGAETGGGLTNEAARVGLPAKIVVAGSRANALRVLRKEGKFSAAQRPALILLDAGAANTQAWSLLRDLKADPQLRRIPIIVLGASNSASARGRAYELHANSYLAPEQSSHRDAVLQRIQDFWLTRVRLPTGT